MKNLKNILGNLSQERYTLLDKAVHDVANSSLMNRSERRRMERKWRKYAKRDGKR